MNLITILGPTASGKTALAAAIAAESDGEIISADSRQVYRGMDIGTGKDLHEYIVKGKKIPVHLIDIADPGEEYNVFRFRKDFTAAYADIISRRKIPVMCGGSGMYLSSVLENYDLPEAGWDQEKMSQLEKLDDENLISILKDSKKLHNTTDLTDRKRLLRAVYIIQNSSSDIVIPEIDRKIIFGIKYERNELRYRITSRLEERLKNGMTDEIKSLLDKGLKPDQLKFYGLEYRYITEYIEGTISYHEMFLRLNIAIHQFAKRQMTWFRRMEKNGCTINWIEGTLPFEEKLRIVKNSFSQTFPG